MFNKLIKVIQIDIGEKLGSKITNRDSDFTLSLSLSLSLVTAGVE